MDPLGNPDRDHDPHGDVHSVRHSDRVDGLTHRELNPCADRDSDLCSQFLDRPSIKSLFAECVYL